MPITLIALLAGIAALVLISGQLGIRGTMLLLALAAVVFFGLFSVRSVEVHRVAEEQQTIAKAKQAETQKMWEHLNRSRIDLSGELTKSTTELVATKSNDSKDKDAPENESKKPNWVGITHHRVGNVLRKVVVSDPYAEVDECYQALQDGKLREILNGRLDELASPRYQPTLERLGLGPDFIWRDVCRDEWIETLETSVGEMKRVHVLMEFDASVDKQIKTAYRKYESRFRVQEVGGVAGLGIGSIALLFGLLKFDTWTKGYYTKRLFFGVPAVIIAAIALLNS